MGDARWLLEGRPHGRLRGENTAKHFVNFKSWSTDSIPGMLGRFECSTSFRQFCFGVGNHGKHTDRKPEQKEPAIMRRLGPILVNYAIAVSPTFLSFIGDSIWRFQRSPSTRVAEEEARFGYVNIYQYKDTTLLISKKPVRSVNRNLFFRWVFVVMRPTIPDGLQCAVVLLAKLVVISRLLGLTTRFMATMWLYHRNMIPFRQI